LTNDLQALYAASDPQGWDACRIDGREFTGGSLRSTTISPDFEVALEVLAGEYVSIAESVSVIDLLEHAVDHLSRRYGLGDYASNEGRLEPPIDGPYRYLTGALARHRKARDRRRRKEIAA